MTGCLEPVFALRPGYRRIYPDLPGMGRSPAPESVASSDDVLAAVLDFVDERVGAAQKTVHRTDDRQHEGAFTAASRSVAKAWCTFLPYGVAR